MAGLGSTQWISKYRFSIYHLLDRLAQLVTVLNKNVLGLMGRNIYAGINRNNYECLSIASSFTSFRMILFSLS